MCADSGRLLPTCKARRTRDPGFRISAGFNGSFPAAVILRCTQAHLVCADVFETRLALWRYSTIADIQISCGCDAPKVILGGGFVSEDREG
jgi:hypothetical protein